MLEQAVEIVNNILGWHGLRAKRFILFGSRARGDHRPDSDWDIFVVLDQELAFPEQQALLVEIKRALARRRIPNDVVLRSEEQFDAMKDSPGVLSYYVAREGIVL